MFIFSFSVSHQEFSISTNGNTSNILYSLLRFPFPSENLQLRSISQQPFNESAVLRAGINKPSVAGEAQTSDGIFVIFASKLQEIGVACVIRCNCFPQTTFLLEVFLLKSSGNCTLFKLRSILFCKVTK